MSRRFTLVAVVLPLLAIVLGIVRAQLFLGRSRDFVFEIGGYDPRDLLRGHYLQFSLRVASVPAREVCVDQPPGTCCLCLTHAEPNQVSKVEGATCATARAECDGVLPLDVLKRPYRFYVPEARATNIEWRVSAAMQRRAAQAVVAVDADGVARVRELRIDGEPIPGGPER
jgi:GDYXXLXY protein